MAAAEPAIRARGLSKRYGQVTALADLDLDLAPGEVVGYLGPNGAGKTTTIRLLLGFIRPTAGRAEIFGVDCQRNPDIAHRRVAFVPAEASLWPSLTGAETLHLFGRLHGQPDSSYRDELIARFDLDPSKKVRAYSRGNRQKVLLIGALMTRADLLVLDEPTSGLDPLMEVAFRHCVTEARERGQAVFLSSHVLSEVEALCDRVVILRDGRVAEAGRLSEMRHLSGVPGVSGVVTDGHSLRCQVTGPVQPLLAALADAGVTRLLSREPSLEELFLGYYGQSEPAEGVAGVAG